MTNKCAICNKINCKDPHPGMDQYVYFVDGESFLTDSGKKKFGDDYLDDLRNKKPDRSFINLPEGRNLPPGYNYNDI